MTFPEPGTRFFEFSWAGTVFFVVTASAAAASPSTFELAAVAVSLTLFFIGIVTMLGAFFIAVNRSRVDAIGVGGLYFGAGSTPRAVRWHLLGATTVQLVAGIGTASIRPFTPLASGTLVWIFGIGMMGLWTACYGEFEPTDEPVDEGVDTEPDTPDPTNEGGGADEA